MTTLQRLHETIAALAPIDGVSVAASGSPPAVGVAFRAEATQGQRAAALAAVASFDWGASAQAAWEDQKQPEAADLRARFTGAITALDAYQALPSPTAAQTQAHVRFLSQTVEALLRYARRQADGS